MTHIEIYKKTVQMYDTVEEFIDGRFKSKKSNTTSALLVTVISSVIHVIDGSIITRFEIQDSFCTSCMYYNLDTVRKTITRYLSLETEIDEETRAFLLNVANYCNEICSAFLPSLESEDHEQCTSVKNEAFDEIQKIIEEEESFGGNLFMDDDDDDDDF